MKRNDIGSALAKYLTLLLFISSIAASDVPLAPIVYESDWGADPGGDPKMNPRKQAFEWAVNMWAERLSGAQTINIVARMIELPANVQGRATSRGRIVTVLPSGVPVEWEDPAYTRREYSEPLFIQQYPSAVPTLIPGENTDHVGFHILAEFASKLTLTSGATIDYPWNFEVFPQKTIAPGEYLVVITGGNGMKYGDSFLSAAINITTHGNYLALYNNASPPRIASQFAPKYPEIPRDWSYSYFGASGYLLTNNPTPQAANVQGSALGVIQVNPAAISFGNVPVQ